MHRVNLLVLAAMVLSTSAAFANAQLYKILFESIPRYSQSCETKATRIEEGFKTGSGIALADAFCREETATYMDIQLNYNADKRVHPVSTIEYTVGVPFSSQGSYHTRRECEQDLPDQVARFIENTGLEPVSSYCYQESTDVRNAFVLRIDAFGAPKRNAFVTTRELFGDPMVSDVNALEAKIRAYAKKKLPALSTIALRTHVLDHAVRTVYYSEKQLPLRVERAGTYASGADCKRAEARAQSALVQAADVPPIFCVHKDLLNSYELAYFQVRTGSYVEPVQHPKLFASYAQCEAYGSTAMAEVVKSMGGTALTAVCHPMSDRIGATVLLRIQ